MTESGRTFGDVVDAHQAEVLRYLRRLTGDPIEAEDLFQETFLRALPAFDRLRTESNHRAWIYRIATNAFLNHRRRQRRRNEVALGVELTAPGRSPDLQHQARAAATACREAVVRPAAKAAGRLRPAKRARVGLLTDCRSDGMHVRGRSSERLSGRPSAASAAGRHGVMS